MNSTTTTKSLALLLVLVFVFALTACTYDPSEAPASTADPSASTDAPATDAEKGTSPAAPAATSPLNARESETESAAATDTDTNAETGTDAVTEPVTEAETPETAQTEPAETEPAETSAPSPKQTADPLPGSADEVFARTVYVGDSICSGFRVYGILPPNNNLAVGNVGARSIFDYSFTVNGSSYDLITALKLVDPSFVVFSMGMNDINMTSPEQYCANYDNILAQVHAAIPNAKLFVASITPTRNDPRFANERIDLFNSTIKSHLSGTGYYYIDINTALRDSVTDSLVSSYDGGDGIHLAPAAYHVIKSVTYSYFKSIGAVS